MYINKIELSAHLRRGEKILSSGFPKEDSMNE